MVEHTLTMACYTKVAVRSFLLCRRIRQLMCVISNYTSTPACYDKIHVTYYLSRYSIRYILRAMLPIVTNQFAVSTHATSKTWATVRLNAVKDFHTTFVGAGYLQHRTATDCLAKAAVFQV